MRKLLIALSVTASVLSAASGYATTYEQDPWGDSDETTGCTAKWNRIDAPCYRSLKEKTSCVSGGTDCCSPRTC